MRGLLQNTATTYCIIFYYTLSRFSVPRLPITEIRRCFDAVILFAALDEVLARGALAEEGNGHRGAVIEANRFDNGLAHWQVLEHCLLSFVNHMRYTYVRTAFPIPTPSAARRLGLGRVGNDL